MPPITAVPIIWRATEPAPVAIHSGTQPRINAKDVIKIGRRRNPGSLERGIGQWLSLLVLILGKLDDQNRILGGQTDEHHQPDLRVHIGLDLNRVSGIDGAEHGPAQPQHREGAKYRDRRAQQHAEGQ